MLLVTRVSMHYVPTLSHGTPLANYQGNKPAEQGIKPPQQQRHNQHNCHNDQRGLSGFLASRPYDFTNLSASFFRQNEEGFTLTGLQRDKCSCNSNHKESKNAVQDRLSRIILITDNTHDNQNDYQEPLQHIKARV
ncbi:hypothetical protein ALP68_101890 [Pseudomonas ficuserectae]|uniref:Uncharacterized protein n=1 Tax=Pseudomonas savastanoi TaxID=29438 RepID=A0A3M5GBJ0_PSESS|nr:hypothetical protein ALO69_102152 [Pseudomonas ficuserectae]RMS33893.1 hypothetical protein ALP67_101773 [Pseudomonas ficuserectae]RMS38651.1 hypothetical protein ALP68_101890 [Pseudomonas ficuserectae]RMS84012.1 hypothetical protein ALP59_102114 [Pseudomonas savastanoi]